MKYQLLQFGQLGFERFDVLSMQFNLFGELFEFFFIFATLR